MDPLVVRLRELERRLTTLMAEWKETYPDIGETKQEIFSVKKQLAEKYGDLPKESGGSVVKTFDPYLRELVKQRNELRAEVASIRERRLRLVEQIKEFEQRVEQTPAREQEVMILVRDYENRQKNYQSLLDKRLNAHVAGNLEKRQKGEQFRVLDPANLPQRPDSPKRLVIMIAGIIGGCGLGVGLAVGLEQLNPTFRRREEVETLSGIRVLAVIPNFFTMYRHQNVKLPLESSFVSGDAASHVPSVRARWRRPTWIPSTNLADSVTPHFNLVARWQPLSIAAEQYRMAASRLVLSTEERESTIIEITSALKGEGKTTTVVNLGYTIARDLGKRTLLIDCDFRCPALHQYVNVPARSGLIELLDGQASLKDCLSVIDEVPCSVMSVGGPGGEQNELTRIQQLKSILPTLRANFDYIIINTPPVLPSATMGILASLADVFILVIRAGITPKPVVQKAFAILGLATEKQVILNGVDAQSMPHYMYGYSMPYGKERSVEGAIR
ncbi:MAG: AAA family ATPase [Nitrospira sp.]